MPNEFSELLKYLELENEKHSKQPVAKKETIKKPATFEDFKEIHSDVKSGKFNNVTSKGFDVSKFESLMVKKLSEAHNNLQNYERPYISVTELCDCLRKSYFFRLKYKGNENFYPYLDLINYVGNKVHEYVLPLYGYEDIEKVVISEKYKVKGRIDGTLNKRILVDLKTEDGEKFYKRKTFNKNHHLQCCIYAYILNTEYDYNIDTITIIYALRNLKKFIPFDLPVDNKLAKSYLDRALQLRKCIEQRKIIEEINSDKTTCHFCPYKEICKKEDIIKNVEKTEDKKEPIFLI